MIQKLVSKFKRIYQVAVRDPKLLLYGPTPPIYGMTTKWEQAYIVEFAQNQYRGIGEIVDLGCWLGSMTICAAMGLAKNRRVSNKAKRIHAYDLFTWTDYDERFSVPWITSKPQVGESILNEYRVRIKSWESFIETHAGDLTEIGWDSQAKIELLHNDASKSWSAMNGVISKFFPSLIPGESIVIEQDFGHFYTSWLHLVHYRFRDYFLPVCSVPMSTSMVFRYAKAIPNDMLQTAYSFGSFTQQEMDDAFNYSLSIADREMNPGILGAKAMLYIWLEDREKARLEIVKAARNGQLRGEIGLVLREYFPEMESWNWAEDKPL